MSLKFNPGNHSYYLDGKRVRGVTSIINDGIPKPALPRWSARVVAEYVADNIHQLGSWATMHRDSLVDALRRTPWTERDEAAVRGTDVHDLAEQIIHGGEADVPDHLLAHVQGYVDFLTEFDAQPILTEVPVGSRTHWYAGKPDFIGHLRALGDEVWLLDWKTSKGVYGETALQTAAYARAEFHTSLDDPKTEHPLPHVERIGVVHITADGSYLYDLGDPDVAFARFLEAKAVSDGKRWRESLITDPVPAPEMSTP